MANSPIYEISVNVVEKTDGRDGLFTVRNGTQATLLSLTVVEANLVKAIEAVQDHIAILNSNELQRRLDNTTFEVKSDE